MDGGGIFGAGSQYDKGGAGRRLGRAHELVPVLVAVVEQVLHEALVMPLDALCPEVDEQLERGRSGQVVEEVRGAEPVPGSSAQVAAQLVGTHPVQRPTGLVGQPVGRWLTELLA